MSSQTDALAQTAQRGLEVDFRDNPQATPQPQICPCLQFRKRWEEAQTCCQQTSRGYLMTFSLILNLLRGKRGPVKAPEVAVVPEEEEGDQGHEQGCQSLLGELLRQGRTAQELAAVPALVQGNQIAPAWLTRGTRSDTMMQIQSASTLFGNKRRERGVRQRRRRQ